MHGYKTALVLGATGGLGGATMRTLLRHGWNVVAMARRTPELTESGAGGRNHVTWVTGDAMNADDVRRAAEGTCAIVHAVNPPGYRNWRNLVLPMIDNTIAAAQAVGARVVLPGTIYNYGPDAFPELKEESPQHPITQKGQIRVALERRLEAASRARAPALIVRFGDFFGPAPGNNWFSQALVTPGQRLNAITYPGTAGVGHAWAYLPDAAATIACLLDRMDELAPFARFHAAGHWDADGTRMVQTIAQALDRADIKIKALPWRLLRLAGLFQETPREIYEMRYLWETPVKLNNDKLTAFLGQEPHTPLPEAVRTTLRALKIS